MRGEQRPLAELTVTREFGECGGEHLRGVGALVVLARTLGEELARGVHEHLRRALVHGAHLLDDNLGGSRHHLGGLGGTDADKLEPTLALDVGDGPLVAGGAQGHADTGGAGATGAAGAVDVGLRLLGGLALHHELDAGDVEAARRHVRRHEGLELVLPEPVEHNLALGLVHVAVESLGTLLELLLERLLKLAAVALGVAEDDDAAVARHRGADEVAHQVGPLAPLAVNQPVLHGTGRLLLLVANQVDGGVPRGEEPAGDVGDPLGKGGGEEHGLEVGVVLGVVQDGLDVLHEAHVEHLVRLVEHPEPELLEAERLAVEVVLDAARGADDDVATLPESALLIAVRGTAVDADGDEAERLTDMLEVGVHLLGELAGGREEGHHRSAALHPAAVRGHRVLAVDDLDDGQDEGEGLAAARARAAHQVFTVEDGLEALRLDAVEGGDSLGLQLRAHLLGEVEVAHVILIHGGVAVGGFLGVVGGSLGGLGRDLLFGVGVRVRLGR